MSILDDLETEFRSRTSDVVTPKLYDSPAFLRSMREAETEACRRGLILRDSRTAAVCEYVVTADDPWITLDTRVLKIWRADLWTPNEDDPTIITKDQLHREHQRDLPSNWQDLNGSPECIVTDVQIGAIRLAPTPTRDGTLKLGVVRLPLVPMTTGPEIPARYHLQLIPWAMYRAYGNEDTELYRPQYAADALAEFTASFGLPVSANDDLWIGNLPNLRRRHTRFF